MMSPQLAHLSQRVGLMLSNHGLRLACAESCTGGLVAQMVTATAGSSDWFECGWVTYTNRAKVELLGVCADTLEQSGAVSEAVAKEMALGALAHSQADVALAITGIAGPTGGTMTKPVGLVCFGLAQRNAAAMLSTPACRTWQRQFHGGREAVRIATAVHALAALLQWLSATNQALVKAHAARLATGLKPKT